MSADVHITAVLMYLFSPYLDEPPDYLWGVFGQRLHFAVENEWHQDVFLIGFQHDVAHCHGWSGYCLTRESEKHMIIQAHTREKKN